MLKSRLASIDFSYSDPVPNFDRSKVKGLVANLIDLDAGNFRSSTALEICAGGKLYNVVVEDEKVGSQLLERGKLRKRVTIIPLNRINAFRMSAEVSLRAQMHYATRVVPELTEQKIAAAKSLAPGKVNLALDLIGYPEDVSAAMSYVFGDVFICADKQAAQAVTFNRNVGVRSVTLEGDVYDPSGTLSGGAAPNSSGILVQVQELNKVQREVDACRRSLDELDREMQSNAKELEAFRRDKRTLELRVHEVGLLQEQVQGSTAAKVSGLFSSGLRCFPGVFAFSSAASHSTFSD